MLNNYKMIKKLENKISELEEKISQLKEKIPKEYEITSIAKGIINDEKSDLKDLYDERERVREKTWNSMKENIDAFAAEYMEQLIKEKVKEIEDKLIVELARKAMNIEAENEQRD